MLRPKGGRSVGLASGPRSRPAGGAGDAWLTLILNSIFFWMLIICSVRLIFLTPSLHAFTTWNRKVDTSGPPAAGGLWPHPSGTEAAAQTLTGQSQRGLSSSGESWGLVPTGTWTPGNRESSADPLHHLREWFSARRPFLSVSLEMPEAWDLGPVTCEGSTGSPQASWEATQVPRGRMKADFL